MMVSTALQVCDEHGQLLPREGGRWVVDEASVVWLRLPGPPWSIELDGRPLLWEPGRSGAMLRLPFAVGRLGLSASRGAEQISAEIEVLPAAHKLGVDRWMHLLRDLEAWLPGVTGGVEGARQAALDRGGVDTPAAVEALLPLVPELEASLSRLVGRLRRRAIERSTTVPIHRVRRADGAALAWVGRHPRVAGWLRPDVDVVVKGASPQVAVTESVDTLAHPANRYVAWLVDRVRARLEEAAQRLAAATLTDLNDAGAWRDGRIRALRRAAWRLRRWRRHGPLASVRPRTASEAALQVLVDDPLYARVHRVGRRLLRWGHQARTGRIATRPSFHLYELWCLLALPRALEQVLPLVGSEWAGTRALSDLASTGAGTRWTARTDSGTTLRLDFNPTFRSQPGGSDRRHSISRERRPDLTLSWSGPAGVGWVALDAKYRAGREAVADAFSSAHLYRDALRWPARGGRARQALLLVPSDAGADVAWFDPAFAGQHGVGAMVLAPGRSPLFAAARLAALLGLGEPTHV